MTSSAERRAPIRVGFYDIEKTIGKGNFAVVKLARHRLTKTEVAIKIIDKTQLAAADLKRAYREVRVLKKLHHPHIIRLYQVMETKNMLYIVSEYAPKGEVFEHIARHGRLPEPAARRLYWQVVSAVDYCHKRGVVHRDLKAENLLLDVEGCVKLADFGFSTWWCPESKLATWCGSPPYAAPEVFEGRQYTGPEVDVWSLGVVLYVFVCGALPFDATTLPVLRDRVLSARYRIPYFMSAECESLVRRMLVKDPARRNTIDQVKRHCWMQGDGPPRLLPSPFHNVAENPNSKQYMDPGIVPDACTEPNEQILRLMASLGIDSPRTRESLRQQRYDHHCAIYFLLLERLRQNGPGCSRDNVTGPPGRMGTVRMFSTDSSTYHRNPRRPSSIAEHAMRKMQPGTSTEAQLQQQMLKAQAAQASTLAGVPGRDAQMTRRISSHTTSVDEGVADLDSLWDADLSGSLGMVGQGTSISSVVTNPALRSRCDWKLPTRGSTGSSNQISIDLSQTSGSPGESVCGSGSTLSSWDSAWEPGGLAASLPSCTAASSAGAGDERRMSLTSAETPLSPSANLTDGSLWAPAATQPPGSPIEFRLGRRASDGLMGKNHAPFSRKLEGTRTGGVVALAETTQMQSDYSAISEGGACGGGDEDETYFDHPENAHLCSPLKRPSLPVSWKPLPPVTWSPPEPYLPQWSGSDGSGSGPSSTSSASHLHRKMMAIRLNRKSAIAEHSDFTSSMDEGSIHDRKPVLRQQSYKLAQQQTVLPPLPLRNNFQDMTCLGAMETRGTFRPITEEEFSHSAQDEDEEGEESDTLEPIEAIMSRNRDKIIEKAWKNLPVTMSDCKLTDSNGSLSRLSNLLQLDRAGHGHGGAHGSPHHPSSPVPYQWDQDTASNSADSDSAPAGDAGGAEGATSTGATLTSHHYHSDRMDTSGS